MPAEDSTTPGTGPQSNKRMVVNAWNVAGFPLLWADYPDIELWCKESGFWGVSRVSGWECSPDGCLTADLCTDWAWCSPVRLERAASSQRQQPPLQIPWIFWGRYRSQSQVRSQRKNYDLSFHLNSTSFFLTTLWDFFLLSNGCAIVFR